MKMSALSSKLKPNRRLTLTLASFAALALNAHTLRAQGTGTALYFDPLGAAQTGAVSGTWDASTTADWDPSAAGSGTLQTFTAGADAHFSAVESGGTIGATTVTLGSAVAPLGIFFDNGTVTESGAFTISVGADGMTVGNNNTQTIGSALTTTGSETWSDTGTGGTLAVNGAITVNGTLSLTAGNIQLGSNGSVGLTGGTNASVVVNGAAVTENLTGFGAAVTAESGSFTNGQGKGFAAFVLAGSSFTVSGSSKGGTFGTITLGSALTGTNVAGYSTVLNVAGSKANSFTNALVGTAAGQTLTLTAATGINPTVGFAAGANNPAVNLNGAGTYTINTGTAAGGTTFSNGVFVINGNSTIGTAGATLGTITSSPGGTGTVTINSGRVESANVATGATLTIANNVTLGGNVAFGAATGATTNTGALVFDGTALATPAKVTLTASPTLTVTNATTINNPIGDGGSGFGLTKAGAGMLTLGGANTYTGATAITAGAFTLTSATALSAASTLSLVAGTTLNLNAAAGTMDTIAGLTLDGTAEPAQAYTAAQLSALDPNITFASTNGETLTVAPVPEPSSWLASFLGMGALGWVLNKRRRADRVNGGTV